MTFLLADTFTGSLARLTGDEQKAVKTTAFDLQMNPASPGAPSAPARWGGRPGMKFHRLDKTKDRNFWSVRVSSDIRIIVHKTDASLLLCYVDHHDPAYAWAERRKLERHPVTGAMQLVEIRETVREIDVPRYVSGPPSPWTPPKSTTPLFDGIEDDELLEYGVPPEWLPDVRRATEDTLFDVASHLPAEASEALLELAVGGTPVSGRPTAQAVAPGLEPPTFEIGMSHPDARRRFRVMENVDDLRRALDAPWETWTVFLHPSQEAVVSRRFNGPARVSGSAGTGKTVVALHRAWRLAKDNPAARVLLTTVSTTLAMALRVKLERLAGGDRQILDRIDVRDITRVGIDLHESLIGPVKELPAAEMLTAMIQASDAIKGHRFSIDFLFAEFSGVVDQWQLTTWDDYRTVARLGRRTRLPESQRALLWAIFERFRATLREQGAMTKADALGRATAHLRDQPATRPWDFVVVDESQDMSVAAIRLVAAIAGDRPDGLFFAGDLGQRIYQSPFSWKALGVDIRGRSQTLRVNYRTSHQIRRQADRLLGAEVADVDHNVEVRAGTVSVFNGPEPEVRVCDSQSGETEAVADWIRARRRDGVSPHEMAVFVRSRAELPRASQAVQAATLTETVLDDTSVSAPDRVAIATMHQAKGLEFRAVVVMACDDDVLPLQARIEGVTDDADLQDVYDTERHLLYVACTRARDWLLVTGVTPGSEFLGDMEAR